MSLLPDRDKLLRNVNRCANWEQKYLYIIELGQRLTPVSPEARTDANRVAGCQSQVWITVEEGADGTLIFNGDSDAALVKGLIAVVIALYAGMTRQAILDVDPKTWFARMDLSHHLTPSRSQGLEAIIRAVRAKSAKS